MIRRRELLLFSEAAALCWPWFAAAQSPKKVWRIGVLSLAAPEIVRHLTRAMLEGLRDFGYVEGENLSREARWGHSDTKRLPGLAAELVALRADAIVTIGPDATYAVAAATKTIPVIFIGLTQPVERGLIVSIARPGGNVTGLSYDVGAGAVVKALELLKRAVPAASRIAILLQVGEVSGFIRDELATAARALAVVAEFVGISSPDEFESAFKAVERQRPDALLVPPSVLSFVHQRRIAQFAEAHRLPAMYAFGQTVAEGGLMAYAADLQALFRRVGAYVDKIFKGAKVGDLPVEQPTKFEFVVNLKTAKALDFTFPATLLALADRVVE